MSTAQSGAHVVQTVAAGSSLAQLLADPTFISGTWRDFPQGSMSHTLTNPGNDSDAVVSNCSVGNWDIARKKVVFVGGGHGNQYQEKVLTFPDASNAWNNSDTPPIPGSQGTDTGVHQFNSQTMDTATGAVFINVQTGPNSGFYYRLGGSSTWVNDDQSLISAHGQRDGSAFNPTMGTAGSVILGSFYGILQYDFGAAPGTRWKLRNSGFGAGGLTLDNAPVGFYDPVSQCAYLCGGNGTSNTQINAAGVCTQKSALPTNCSVPTSAALCAVVVDGYTTPGGVVRRPMIIRPGGGMWEYHGENDTWPQLSGTAPQNPDLSDNAMFYTAVSTYDCVLATYRSNALGDCISKAYKR